MLLIPGEQYTKKRWSRNEALLSQATMAAIMAIRPTMAAIMAIRHPPQRHPVQRGALMETRKNRRTSLHRLGY